MMGGFLSGLGLILASQATTLTHLYLTMGLISGNQLHACMHAYIYMCVCPIFFFAHIIIYLILLSPPLFRVRLGSSLHPYNSLCDAVFQHTPFSSYGSWLHRCWFILLRIFSIFSIPGTGVWVAWGTPDSRRSQPKHCGQRCPYSTTQIQ